MPGLLNQPDLEFDANGGRTAVELTIRNLRPDVSGGRNWETVRLRGHIPGGFYCKLILIGHSWKPMSFSGHIPVGSIVN